jgi:hypothetical protein
MLSCSMFYAYDYGDEDGDGDGTELTAGQPSCKAC